MNLYLFFVILALSRKFQELKHRSDHPTELRKACPTCCVPCYYGPRNGTQFWVSGKSTIFIILNKLLTHELIVIYKPADLGQFNICLVQVGQSILLQTNQFRLSW